jgi:ESCRT-II complex subunit VPS36
MEPVDLQSLPFCQSCGIKASQSLIQQALDSSSETNDSSSSTNCPTCTFINHPSMKNCEICGTQLSVLSKIPPKLTTTVPPPTLNISLEGEETYSLLSPYIKVSFRKGGELKFHQALSQILDDIKWKNLNDSGGINVNAVTLKSPTSQPKDQSGIAAGGGIRRLEQIGENQRKLNETILTNSLNDLEQMMFKFQDLVHLTKAVNSCVVPEVKQVVPPLQIKRSNPLYLPELARNLSEYTTKIFKSPSSMITSQDLFASYNRYLVTTQGFGATLITPQDFNQVLALLLQLNLPISMHKYENSGLVVLSPKQTEYKSYEKFIVEFLQAQYRQYKYDELKGKVIGNPLVGQFRGSTITEICNNFNWAYDITIEEIQRGVDLGTITIDNHISGTFYYLNVFTTDNYDVNMRELLLNVKHDLAAEQHHLEHQISQKTVQEQPPKDGLSLSLISLQDTPSTESVCKPMVIETSPDVDISHS